jgi:hypothetical protein
LFATAILMKFGFLVWLSEFPTCGILFLWKYNVH